MRGEKKHANDLHEHVHCGIHSAYPFPRRVWTTCSFGDCLLSVYSRLLNWCICTQVYGACQTLTVKKVLAAGAVGGPANTPTPTPIPGRSYTLIPWRIAKKMRSGRDRSEKNALGVRPPPPPMPYAFLGLFSECPCASM